MEHMNMKFPLLVILLVLSGAYLPGCQPTQSVNSSAETPAPTAEATSSEADEGTTAELEAQLANMKPGPTKAKQQPVNLVAEVEMLRREVVATRKEIHHLQVTLDVLVNQVMTDLAEENDFLRSEIVAIYDEQIEFEENALNSGLLAPVAEDNPDMPRPEAYETAYTIISEWGRSPEDAAKLPGKVASLKGMIIAVPENWGSGEIETLGRNLHEDFTDYDNINIEILRGVAAAEAYSEDNAASANARAMSISKHKTSGRDLLLYIEDEEVTVLTP